LKAEAAVKKAAEEARIAEDKRLAEEKLAIDMAEAEEKRLAEEARLKAEAAEKKDAEEARIAQDKRKDAEEARMRLAQEKTAEESRIAEDSSASKIVVEPPADEEEQEMIIDTMSNSDSSVSKIAVEQKAIRGALPGYAPPARREAQVMYCQRKLEATLFPETLRKPLQEFVEKCPECGWLVEEKCDCKKALLYREKRNNRDAPLELKHFIYDLMRYGGLQIGYISGESMPEITIDDVRLAITVRLQMAAYKWLQPGHENKVCPCRRKKGVIYTTSMASAVKEVSLKTGQQAMVPLQILRSFIRVQEKLKHNDIRTIGPQPTAPGVDMPFTIDPFGVNVATYLAVCWVQRLELSVKEHMKTQIFEKAFSNLVQYKNGHMQIQNRIDLMFVACDPEILGKNVLGKNGFSFEYSGVSLQDMEEYVA
jgi:hypothetical protein